MVGLREDRGELPTRATHHVPSEDVGGWWGRRNVLTALLAVAIALSVLRIDRGRSLIHSGGLEQLVEILGGLVRPELGWGVVGGVLRAAWTTVAYAVAGMTVALAVGIPAGILASGTLVRRPGLRRATMVTTRAFLGFTRAIHELVWAWLLVAAIGLSPLVAVLALAIPYSGILGRIYADLLNDVPAGPLRSLRSAGASEAGVVAYGRLAMALPDMVAYGMYRFECAIRSSAIMSFVGLGGLGFQIELALDDLRFGLVATSLYALMLLVVAVDWWSSEIRRRMMS